MRSKTGIVVSNKMQGTIVVAVEYSDSHPIYKKPFTTTSKFYADVPATHNAEYNIGDTVTIYETKPISKTKRWTVVKPEKLETKAA